MRFAAQDADAWYLRNKEKLGIGHDPVMAALEAAEVPLLGGVRVFEFGCANGWRLKNLIERYKCDCWGSEISPLAVHDADPRILMNLEPAICSCHVVIFGFCLYLIQPGSLFYWVYYADQILADGGYIVIYDFLPDEPHARTYTHNPVLNSRKMDHARLWLSHPGYSLMLKRPSVHNADERTHVTILKKNMRDAFPVREENNVVP